MVLQVQHIELVRRPYIFDLLPGGWTEATGDPEWSDCSDWAVWRTLGGRNNMGDPEPYFLAPGRKSLTSNSSLSLSKT